ncbi:ornithine transcarbamylase, mitochondrial-like [Battus philenor]|uniref:ornithine transcarbamylase, mitochondrial-like n=1 Tax=Battus philenor TaxID=42288 RepID=UPI0035CFAAC0
MVQEIIMSAINLKLSLWDTHFKRLNILKDAKVMLLQEVNEPVLKMAVSKAATLMGANDVTVKDNLIWEQDYLGRIFSMMSDVIFVATSTQKCVARFSAQSTVPVICVKSRAHGSLQALATVMSIIEDYGTMNCLNIAYIGKPHPVLNSYLLLCPMLGANFKFKCCCPKCPVSPLLYKTSKDMTEQTHTSLKQCKQKAEVLSQACVIIAGPATKQEKADEFKFTIEDINKYSFCNWTFYHTCPWGQEVNENLFYHSNARTFKAFNNMQFIAAALMAKSVKGRVF